jgi:hypothetical protein
LTLAKSPALLQARFPATCTDTDAVGDDVYIAGGLRMMTVPLPKPGEKPRTG